MAIDRKARLPKEEIIPLRTVRFSGRALTAGVETHSIKGVKVKIYNPAKTVADCFKYRNKIGLDVAMEALRDCWRKKKATSDGTLVLREGVPRRPHHATISGVYSSVRKSETKKIAASVRQCLANLAQTQRRFSAVAVPFRP
jgi:hypothetical protein